MRGEPLHVRQFGGVDVPLEREGDLHDRDAGGGQPAQDGLVGGERLGVGGVDVVVGGEVHEDEVGPVGQDIAVEAERPELGAGAADGRVAEAEMGGRIVLLEPVTHHGPIRGLDRVGRIGPPRQRRPEEDDVQAVARLGPGIEIGKGAELGFRRQGRRCHEDGSGYC